MAKTKTVLQIRLQVNNNHCLNIHSQDIRQAFPRLHERYQFKNDLRVLGRKMFITIDTWNLCKVWRSWGGFSFFLLASYLMCFFEWKSLLLPHYIWFHSIYLSGHERRCGTCALLDRDWMKINLSTLVTYDKYLNNFNNIFECLCTKNLNLNKSQLYRFASLIYHASIRQTSLYQTVLLDYSRTNWNLNNYPTFHFRYIKSSAQ